MSNTLRFPAAKKWHRIARFALGASLVIAAFSKMSVAQVVRLDGPVAIVNERVITERQVAKAARSIDGGSSPLETRKAKAFQALLFDAILAQAQGTAVFDDRMIDERVKQQTRFREEQEGSRSELQALLASQGETLEDYRKQQKEELRRRVLYEHLSARIGPTGRAAAEGYVSPRRMQLWYRLNPKEFSIPAAIKARICTAPLSASDGGAGALAQARAWIASTDAGTPLSAIASEASSFNPSGSGELSGDGTGELQWVSIEADSTLDPALRRAIEGRGPGVVPEPIRTVEGYVVIELIEVRTAARQAFSDPEVQRAIEEKLRRQWLSDQEKTTFDELRAKSFLWPSERLRGGN